MAWPHHLAGAGQWNWGKVYRGKGFAVDTLDWHAVSLFIGPHIMHFAPQHSTSGDG